MARKQPFRPATFTAAFQASYARLDVRRAKDVDRCILALIKDEPTPGLRVKPILPAKVYFEARANDGDRVVFCVEGGTLVMVDVVSHDDVGRYGGGR